ncbi:hypothetical protein [Shouchella patagoniensis]|uniref:hypothetical protein n=1 Tax=Shouchella patagoniensis TaxID=228576 RepID=UPI0009959B1A|nr:hypothetical protein [Shouchella patagoniensis]
MFDWLNPNVGTYRFPFDEEAFEVESRQKIERIQDQMATGTAQMNYANTILGDQEGAFVESLLERLDKLVGAEETKMLFIQNSNMLHAKGLAATLSDNAKQKYDVHTELDQDALTRSLEKMSNSNIW